MEEIAFKPKIMKEDLKVKLRKFNYKFKEDSDSIYIILGLGLSCKVHFLKDESFEIKGFLNKWNILTGFIQMDMSQVIVYNSIWLAFLLAIQLFFSNSKDVPYPYLPFIILILLVFWYFYYLIRYYTFKTTLINWLDSAK